MIDTKLFTVERLVSTILDTSHGNHNKWWALAEIIPDYVAPHAREDDRPRCVVRCRNPKNDHCTFLRYLAGPKQGYFWDMYGEDFLTSELALLALVEAPIPPGFIDLEVWRATSDAERLDRML